MDKRRNKNFNASDLAVDYLAQQDITALSTYGAAMLSPAIIERSIRLLYAGKLYLNNDEVYCHMVGLTDFIVCAYSNMALYPIYQNTEVQVRKLAWRLKQLSYLWSHYFRLTAPNMEAVGDSMKLVNIWDLMLQGTAVTGIFQRTRDRAYYYVQKARRAQMEAEPNGRLSDATKKSFIIGAQSTFLVKKINVTKRKSQKRDSRHDS